MTGTPLDTEPPDPAALSEALVRLRSQIEEIDHLIVRLLARRIALARDAGAIKSAGGLPAVDPDREQAVLDRVAAWACEEGMSEADIRRLFARVIEMARTVQDASDGPQVDRM